MESKKKKDLGLRPEAVSPTDLMQALKEAGYTLVRRFSRKGDTLTLYLKPAALKGKDGNFRALETCAAIGQQADCRVHATLPENILILTVDLPESDGKQTDASQTDQSEIGTQKSKID